MLTPENLQLHSEAAALLLIWAANSIKQYAAFKSLQLKNDPYNNINHQVIKFDSVTQQTKHILEQQHSNKKSPTKQYHKTKL